MANLAFTELAQVKPPNPLTKEGLLSYTASNKNMVSIFLQWEGEPSNGGDMNESGGGRC